MTGEKTTYMKICQEDESIKKITKGINLVADIVKKTPIKA